MGISYASVVRDGSGDAIFVFGTSPNAGRKRPARRPPVLPQVRERDR